jgi:hypothetical protein
LSGRAVCADRRSALAFGGMWTLGMARTTLMLRSPLYSARLRDGFDLRV